MGDIEIGFDRLNMVELGAPVPETDKTILNDIFGIGRVLYKGVGEIGQRSKVLPEELVKCLLLSFLEGL